MELIDKIRAEVEKKTHREQGYRTEDAECGYRDCASEILSFLDTIETTEDEHWQEIRERAAIAAMQGLLANSSKVGKIVDYTMSAVDYADALVEQLKKKSQ